MKRQLLTVPLSAGAAFGTYNSQRTRYRIESVCGVCAPTTADCCLMLIITTGGSLGQGVVLAWHATPQTVVAGVNTQFTLAPGLTPVFATVAATMVRTGSIPYELWIEQGWEIQVSYTDLGATPTSMQDFRLVISVPE